MSHPYLLLSDSTNSSGKLLVGQSATSGSSGSSGCGLTDKNVRAVEIPSTYNGKEVVEIGYNSFRGTGITSVFIPNTILCIYYCAFHSCSSLAIVRFEEGSRVWKFGLYVLAWDYSLKKIDFPASVTSIETSSGGIFFRDVSLDCFSYAGTTDFSSSTRIFETVTTVYVSNSYQPSTFAGKTVTKGTKTCGVSSQYFIDPTRTRALKHSVCSIRFNVPFQHYMFLLIQS
jgi:hypothetical protein